ncbi:MAG TPA: DUF2065 domain-containing protein [Piscirickettsiaceae bacterium]|nr:DUF2065 domain-containing protein [Piscirickettsiaceae bacterium]HIQ40629.1 DUF2065 domain-containing protein [Sulfurivirga caldicuralii]
MTETQQAILWAAVGLAFIFEGILPFAFPEYWRRIMREATQLSEMSLRLMGLSSILLGLLVIYLTT